MSENKGNKLVVDDIEVIVRGVANKPYYEIKYREVGNDWTWTDCTRLYYRPHD